MDKEFKYELGDFVKHVTQEGKLGVKMLVIGRTIWELLEEKDEEYLVSYYDYGRPVTARVSAMELMKYQ